MTAPPRPSPMTRSPVETAPGLRLGHVHLKVADLDRAVAFYRDVVGLDVMQRFRDAAAFMSADGYHHHLGLNVWESRDGAPPPAGATGLYHSAFLFPTRAELARAVRRAVDAGVAIDGASDHGVSEAVYLRDPDENGVEFYWDRPHESWPVDADGRLAMFTRRLDLDALMAEAPSRSG